MPEAPAPLRMGFVMDPPAIMDIEADTTFALMLAAQERGHGIWFIDPGDLGVRLEGATAWVRPITLRRKAGDFFELGPSKAVVLDDAFDVVWQRKDPPVDADYVTATQILGLCRRARVLNRPSAILASNEKLYALNFPELMAETLVSRHSAELLAFLDALGGEMIVKPLDGRGGEGVFHVHRQDRNLTSILEQSTRFGDRAIMAQRYLPAIREGDKRILLVEGEPLGALLRVPSDAEHRANLHVGGRAVKTGLDEDDLRIVDALGPWLRRDGLFFVGIDVIGGKLTEVNVTSPTGIQEMGRLDGVRYEETVIERVEALGAA